MDLSGLKSHKSFKQNTRKDLIYDGVYKLFSPVVLAYRELSHFQDRMADIKVPYIVNKVINEPYQLIISSLKR